MDAQRETDEQFCRRIDADFARRIRWVVRQWRNDADLADDVYQVTLINAWKYRESYRKDRPLWPWLRRIAHRVWCRMEQEGRRSVLASPLIDEPCGTFGDDEETEETGRLWHALEQLNWVDRLLVCASAEIVSYDEVAEEIRRRGAGRSTEPGALRVAAHRARERLKRLLNESDLGEACDEGC